MRALFLTPQLPYPPSKGTTLRNFNLIKNLAAENEVHLFSFVESDEEIGAAHPLKEYCRSIYGVPMPPKRPTRQRLFSTLLSPLPDMALRLPSEAFHKGLGALLARERFDVVQVEGIEMAQYVDTVLSSGRPKPAIIFDDHNAEYVLQQRAFETDVHTVGKWPGAFYSLIQWQKLRRYERIVSRKAGSVVAVSEADRRAILELDPSLDIAVVSNGIDVDFFGSPGGEPTPSDGIRLVFVGTMDYRPNIDAMVWFCREIFPLVLREMPEVRMQIVGRDPAKAVRDAAGRNVDVLGSVEDVRPYIRRSSVYVVPMRIGGGVRFKVLEAMACGVPVVSTGMGAEGIDVVAGEHLFLAEEPAEFASRVGYVLQNRLIGATMAAKARERVTALYDWRVIVPRLEDVWRKCVGEITVSA